ncbi:aspartate--tRNA ligase [Patescibacteria group bacterium]|nr:aspartate--tRNA ligase [Patescibacteria group bacterium]
MKRIQSEETINKIEKEVKLCGWVNSRRNMGKIVFVDLRDRSGLVQIVFVPQELDQKSQKAVKEIRPEFVIEVEGVVHLRPKNQINKDLMSGKIEILAKKLSILNQAKTPPFEIDNETLKANEELRLKYRYLDLRHERMKNNILMRSKMMHFIRNYLHEKNFVEIHTPILSKSTPEGARDYLVPSRRFPGKFFALPQSPQQYKQMLMIAGMEKYFQIAPCFRDEDARADRSPGEFYQIDIEMSFIKQEYILQLTEEMFTKMIKKLWPEKKMTFNQWPRLDWQEVMDKYGTDKPDLRKNKTDKNELSFVFIVDFPLFVSQANNKDSQDHFHGVKSKWAPSHHMFTAPKEKDIPLLDTEPGKVRSYQHDLVLNGIEIGGGSIRIHDPKLQEKIFDLIGFTEKDKKKFAYLLRAFEYGAPPHGGIAPGFDRLLAILQGEKNIREVIAFPLTADAKDLMMGAPSEVSKEQLQELGISIRKNEIF